MLGDRIRTFRKLKQLSQKTLALRMEVSDRTISSWEAGRTEPDSEDIKKLCRYLDCSPNDLYGMGEGIKLSSSDIDMIQRFKDADEYDKMAVYRILHRERS